MVQSAPLLDQRSFCLLLSFFVWCCRVGKCSIMNMIQAALCLTRILLSGVEFLCWYWCVGMCSHCSHGACTDKGFLSCCACLHDVHQWGNRQFWHQSRGYIKAQPMAQPKACLVNAQSSGAGAAGCCMLLCYPSHFRFLGKNCICSKVPRPLLRAE